MFVEVPHFCSSLTNGIPVLSPSRISKFNRINLVYRVGPNAELFIFPESDATLVSKPTAWGPTVLICRLV